MHASMFVYKRRCVHRKTEHAHWILDGAWIEYMQAINKKRRIFVVHLWIDEKVGFDRCGESAVFRKNHCAMYVFLRTDPLLHGMNLQTHMHHTSLSHESPEKIGMLSCVSTPCCIQKKSLESHAHARIVCCRGSPCTTARVPQNNTPIKTHSINRKTNRNNNIWIIVLWVVHKWRHNFGGAGGAKLWQLMTWWVRNRPNNDSTT